jgi:predicted RND superfamily exporter protein
VATNDQSSFLPESADATQVSERLPDFLGSDTIPAVVVVTGESALTDDDLAAIQDLSEEIAGIDGVQEGVSPPIESEDGEAAQIFVPIDSSGEVRVVVEEIRTMVSEQLPSNLQGWVTGPAGFTADLVKGFLGIDGLLLIVALLAVFIILVIVYRSPLLPILVLLTSVFALCVAPSVGLVAGLCRRLRVERAGAGHPVHPGDRCRHRLRPSVRRALPRSDRTGAAGGRPPRRRGAARSSRSSRRVARSSPDCCACCSPTSPRTAHSAR